MPTPEPHRRRTRSELRELMLENGKALLLASKRTIGFEDITYAQVFERVKRTTGQTITRGSVHERIWNSQRDFQLDVIENIVSETAELLFDAGHTGALEAMKTADLSSPAGRRYTTQNVVRLSQNHSWKLAADQTDNQAVALAVRFRLADLEPDDPEALVVADHIMNQRQTSVRIYNEMIATLMDTIGLRFKPALGPDPLSLLTVLSNAMNTALMSDPLPIAQDLLQLPTGPDQKLEYWTTAGIGIWLVTKSMVELDDDTITAAERQL